MTELKALGALAAQKFSSGQASSLQDAVDDVIADKALNYEQVRRVSAAANKETLRTKVSRSRDPSWRIKFETAKPDLLLPQPHTKESMYKQSSARGGEFRRWADPPSYESQGMLKASSASQADSLLDEALPAPGSGKPYAQKVSEAIEGALGKISSLIDAEKEAKSRLVSAEMQTEELRDDLHSEFNKVAFSVSPEAALEVCFQVAKGARCSEKVSQVVFDYALSASEAKGVLTKVSTDYLGNRRVSKSSPLYASALKVIRAAEREEEARASLHKISEEIETLDSMVQKLRGAE